MKKLPFLWGIIIILLSVAGCRPSNHRALLQRADSLMTDYPDSVLSLLAQQQEHLADFSEEELMSYVWIKAMVHSARNISMTEDSLLPKAVDYFRKHGDREKVMKGYILKANYLKWIDRLDDAIAELDSGWHRQSKPMTPSMSATCFIIRRILFTSFAEITVRWPAM